MLTAGKINVDILTGQKLSHFSHPVKDELAPFRKVVVFIFFINKAHL